jgi:hypothetical protein
MSGGSAVDAALWHRLSALLRFSLAFSIAATLVGHIVAPLPASAEQSISIVISPIPLEVDGTADGQGWKKGSQVELEHEITYGKVAPGDSTQVRLLADRSYLYVSYVVTQAAPITDTQKTNGVGWGTDDGVGVALWPGGRNGFQYTFESNPSGNHYQYSSENTAFQPTWSSVGRAAKNGYEVTMAIPLSVIKGDGRDQWLIQIYRTVAKTGQYYVWYYAPGEGSTMTPQYAGVLSGMKSLAHGAGKPPTRVSVYGLAESAPQSYGGDTSRIGGDFSLPINRTVSLFGTVHPDYSNVEIDQQTIAPTQFPRVYSEVRPFFTQAQSFYNPSGFSLLYTPAIPTPAWGAAYEGVLGQFKSAAFDAQGDGRDDNAFVLRYGSPNGNLGVGFQRVQASYPGVIDTTTSESIDYDNQRNFSVYGSTATDTGTNVLQSGLNQNDNLGINYYGPKGNVTVNYLSTGLYFNPVDGYVAHPDVRGLNYSASKEIDFSSTSSIVKLVFSAYADSYENHFGEADQSDTYASVGLTTRHLLTVSWSTGASYLLQPGYGMTPFTQQGPSLTWAPNPALPSDFGLRTGHYYNGYLHSLYWDTTVPLGKASRTLGMDYYLTLYSSPSVSYARQTLFRIYTSWQLSRNASVSLGWRTIDGSPPYFTRQPAAKGDNFSAAFADRLKIGNLYVVYGDPNAFSTSPTLIIKLVHYILGQEGT